MPFIQHLKSSSCTASLISASADRMNNDENISGDPMIQFTIKPSNKMRFRYSTEKGSHGVLTGCTDPDSTRRKKVYPTVQLKNYCGKKPVYLQISLYTVDEKQRHVYYLYGKDCEDEICRVKFGKDFTATFQASIGKRKKEEVLQILRQRKEQDGWSGNDKYIEDELRNINLNAAKLCLEAYVDGEKENCLCRTFSDVISNSKSTETGDLKICRLSKFSGSCSGGEEVFLFCDKVKKENVRVRFYEEKDDVTVWEDFGIFAVADWHHQVALVFKTPRYKENVECRVWIELLRTTDNATSEPREFLYLPDETDMVRKRKRIEPSPSASTISCEALSNESGLSENSYDPLSNVTTFQDITKPMEVDIQPFSVFDSDLLLPGMDNNYGMPSSLIGDCEFFSSILNSSNENQEENLTASSSVLGIEQDFPSYLDDFNQFDLMPENVKTDAVAIKLSSLNIKSGSTLTRKENKMSKPKALSSSKEITFKEAMFEAFSKGNIKSLLRFSFHLIPMKDTDGNSLLHLAVIHQGKNLEFISKLLELMPKYVLNYQNKTKKTPLHIATESNNLKLVKLLLLHGAQPNIQDSSGDSCIHIACKMNFAAALKEFLPVLKSRKDLSTSNYEGLTPLHVCTTEESGECLKILVGFGADLNVQDKKSGRTPLHFAIQSDLQIFKFLLSQPKIDKNIEDFSGRTVLDYAECSDFAGHKIFIEKQADDFSDDSKGVAQKKSCAVAEISKDSFCDSNESMNRNIQTDSIPFLSHSEVRKLCTLMDPPHKGWRSFAMCLGLEDICDSILRIESKSPTKALLKKFQNMYPENQLEILKNFLIMAELHEAANALQENC